MAAINSYSPGYIDAFGKGVRTFFNHYLHHEERARFFSHTLPKMQSLALKLPTIVTKPIPFLPQNSNMSITMSKYQISSILANLFFNTFPHLQDKELPRGQNFASLFIPRLVASFRKCHIIQLILIFNKTNVSEKVLVSRAILRKSDVL